MKIITEEIKGDLRVTTDTQYNNVVGANITVEERITVRIFGTINNLYLRKEATVYLHGKITGNVFNEGGILNLFRE